MRDFSTIFLRFLLLGALCCIPLKAAAQYVHSYSFPTAAGVGCRLTEPAAYDQSFHVRKTGNDANPGTADQPLLTIGKALEKAKASLQAGRKTKILVYPGTYVESVKETSWNNGDNTTKRTLLCIEGQNATGSVTMQPRSDAHHALWLQGKHSVIIRNLILDGAYQNNYVSEGGALLVTYGSWGNLVERYQDWLVENCEFKNSNGSGIALHHNEYSTFRNITVKDNKGGGGSVALRYCLVDGLTLTNNNLADQSRFSNGGLFWISAHTILRNSNMSSNRGAGLRMDHSCVNSVFENITADNNQDQGLNFETASGPILIKNCRARNNRVGLILATVYDVVVDGCTFADNTRTQVEYALMKRDDPSLCVSPGWYCTSSNYDTAPVNGTGWTNSLGLTSNRRIEMVNNTITTTKGAASYLVQFATTDRGYEYIPLFLSGGYWGSNNRYFNPDNDNVFGLTPETYADFDGWRARTGKESGSIWGTGGPVPAAPTLGTRSANGANSVTVQWTDNASNETGFRVQRKRGLNGNYVTVANLASGTTSYTNTGLTASTTYYYRVKAVNQNGTSTSAEGSVTTPGPGIGDIAFAVNAGGGPVVAANGTTFEEDYNFTGGGTYTWANTFTNTADPALYGPHRYGSFSYAVAVPNGTYEVNFHLTEPGGATAGGRVFNIRSEGDTLVRGLDVYKRTGARNVAYVLTRTVDVTDGTLNLNFDGSTGSQDANGLVQALEVRRSDRKKTTDELADFSKTFARTSGLSTTGGSGTSNGDNSLVSRNSNSTQSVTYKAGDIRDFTVSFIYHTTFPATVRVLRSANNGTYTTVTIDSAFKATSGGWYLATFTPRTNLSGTDYLKIEVSGGAQTWTPYFSRVELWHNGAFNSTGTATCAEVTGPATVIGTTGSWNNSGNTREKAFDGDVNTYFDAATPDGNWTGRDLGSARTICKISYHPRTGSGSRLVGGKFQGSNTADFSSGVVDLATIATAPATAWTDVTVSNTSSFRYVRYLSPAGSYGNIAEIKIHASSAARLAAAVPQKAGSLDHPGKQLRLYPNPSDGETVLQLAGFAGEKEVVVTITDLTGKRIHRLVVKPGSDLDATRISTAGMAPGMYAVRVQGYETMKAQKLVVR